MNLAVDEAMPRSMAERGLRPIWGALRWLRGEFRASRPVFFFFLIGFLLVLTIVKLALADYSVEVSTISRALVGALVAAKVVLVLDRTPISRRLANYPHIFRVTLRTLTYGMAVVVLGYAERVVDTLRKVGSLDLAIQEVVDHTSAHRLLAVALGISLVFAAYFVLAEVSSLIGEQTLWDLFFSKPSDGRSIAIDARIEGAGRDS
jgi:hypothetical protein